jgi:taurine dioxygenase
VSYTTIDVTPQSAAVGAEIHGIDLAGELSNEQFSEVRQAFHEYGVIFFRDQNLQPEQHLAFARRFGAVNINRFFTPVEGHPEIAEVLKEPEQKKNIGAVWHTDHSYDQIPALGSALYGKEIPALGGDTLFASMASAFEALSDGLKDTLRSMRAVHSSRHVFGPGRYAAEENPEEISSRYRNADLATQDAVHPVVIHHPDTGRETLYVNKTFTVRFDGWTADESRPLLEFLYAHGARPEFSCRFRWRKGSLALWDNRATWHVALNDYQGYRRYMHRVTIEGVALS